MWAVVHPAATSKVLVKVAKVKSLTFTLLLTKEDSGDTHGKHNPSRCYEIKAGERASSPSDGEGKPSKGTDSSFSTGFMNAECSRCAQGVPEHGTDIKLLAIPRQL